MLSEEEFAEEGFCWISHTSHQSDYGFLLGNLMGVKTVCIATFSHLHFMRKVQYLVSFLNKMFRKETFIN